MNVRVSELVQYNFFGDERGHSLEQLKTFDAWAGMVNFVRRDGHRVWLESTVKTIRDSSGDITGYAAINTDISALMDLQYNHEQLVHTFSYIDEGVCITSRDYRVIFANSRFSKTIHAVFGVHMSASHSLMSIRDDGFRQVLLQQTEQIGHIQKVTGEYAVPKHDGNVATIAVRAFLMPHENREENICFLIRNITKDKIEERRIDELTATKRLFENYMDSTSLVAWITNQQGNKLYVNRQYRELFNISEAYPNKHLSEILPPELAERYLAENTRTFSTEPESTTIEAFELPSGIVKNYRVERFRLPYQLHGEALVAGWAMQI